MFWETKAKMIIVLAEGEGIPHRRKNGLPECGQMITFTEQHRQRGRGQHAFLAAGFREKSVLGADTITVNGMWHFHHESDLCTSVTIELLTPPQCDKPMLPFNGW